MITRLVHAVVPAALLLSACAAIPGQQPATTPSTSPTRAAEDVDADARAAIATWPVVTEEMLTPPAMPTTIRPEQVEEVRDAARTLMYYGHVHPDTLRGSLEPLRTKADTVGFDIWNTPPDDVLALVTRFGDGWVPIGPARAKGQWDATVDTGWTVLVNWRGTFAYDLERDGERRIHLVARTVTVTLSGHDPDDTSLYLDARTRSQWIDVCRTHVLTAVVPQDEPPTGPHELLENPERPDFSGSYPSDEERLAQSGCPDAKPKPLT